MNSTHCTMSRLESACRQLTDAARDGHISASALPNIEKWLREPRYAKYSGLVVEHIERGDWQTLDDVFWTVIPFGTGGRRGRMYPIGCNAINDRTIGESAQGLADYVRQHATAPYSCAIAYDTRHRSDAFAGLCAEIMAAAGFRVYLLQPFRSTPELSFAIRHFGCQCGIMVTASHNPPSDNAVKVYWSTGGQLLPPHDQGVIACVESVAEIRQIPREQAERAGQIVDATAEADREYLRAVVRQQFPGPRQLRVLYSPLHGVGSTAVLPALAADGFHDVHPFTPHAEPDGDFPNVPGHVANPENPQVFDPMMEQARVEKADLILATDPDCDRVGCATPVTPDPAGAWRTFTGNQIAALLTHFVLDRMKQAGRLSADHFVVKTLVTTELVRKIADHFQVRTVGDLHVGFKWIADAIDRHGPSRFVIGVEESHGYLVGDYARDKDAAVAAMLLAELTAALKAEQRTMAEQLTRIYQQFGYHSERLVNIQMPGSDGMERMQELMRGLRERMPKEWGGIPVARMRDYSQLVIRRADGTQQELEGPRGDLLFLDFDDQGNSIAIRPSGTEPKIKFYLFAVADRAGAELAASERAVEGRLDRMAEAVRNHAARTS